ncbi:B9D2 [Lepeophtheirus salmonis]|uniref:B9 domain-containing protein 2 n=1 Tax=Lepeophtheirus salmonis TaxID=72036 RepID=A0A7R8CJV8_LEPSM|nr:B9D2 [Lepeophtheirus salmonis]CAF2844548.1 B9D2 [Lepeophtheirus salmonis]
MIMLYLILIAITTEWMRTSDFIYNLLGMFHSENIGESFSCYRQLSGGNYYIRKEITNSKKWGRKKKITGFTSLMENRNKSTASSTHQAQEKKTIVTFSHYHRIKTASEFEFSGGLFCKWSLHYGGAWRNLEGLREGQTQTCNSEDCCWSHPIDVHFATKGLQGYGFFWIPSSPGSHNLEIRTWKPLGTPGASSETLATFYLGGGHRLKNPDLLLSSGNDRFRLTTTASGLVTIDLKEDMDSFRICINQSEPFDNSIYCGSSKSLFCLIPKDTEPPEYELYKNKKSITDIKTFDEILSRHPRFQWMSKSTHRSVRPYKYNDLVYAQFNNNTIGGLYIFPNMPVLYMNNEELIFKDNVYNVSYLPSGIIANPADPDHIIDIDWTLCTYHENHMDCIDKEPPELVDSANYECLFLEILHNGIYGIKEVTIMLKQRKNKVPVVENNLLMIGYRHRFWRK